MQFFSHHQMDDDEVLPEMDKTLFMHFELGNITFPMIRQNGTIFDKFVTAIEIAQKCGTDKGVKFILPFFKKCFPKSLKYPPKSDYPYFF